MSFVLVCQFLLGLINTLALSNTKLITAAKCFMTQAPGANLVKLLGVNLKASLLCDTKIHGQPPKHQKVLSVTYKKSQPVCKA